MRAQEIQGYWWLPGREEKAVPGNLRFSREAGGHLNVLGTLKELDSTFGLFNPEVILGVSTAGKEITLYRCAQSGGRLSFPGIPTSDLYVGAILIGAHVNDAKGMLLGEMSVSYDRLPEWARLPAFTRTHTTDTGSTFQCSINYAWPPEHRIDFKGTRIRFVPQLSMEGDSISRAALLQELYIEVTPPEPRHLEDYLDGIFYQVRNFLTLGIGKPVFPMSIKAKLFVTETSDPPPKRPEVEILFRVPGSPSEESLHPLFMLFAFSDISADYERVLNNWFEKAEELGPICDLYFGTFYNPTMYLQSQFLVLAQAVEAFHRRRDDRGYLTDTNFKALLRELQNVVRNYQPGINEETMCAFMSRLNYVNEYTLKGRLEELIGGLGALADSVIVDRTQFIKLAGDTRNYLTHYDKELKAKSASVEEMHHLVNRLQFILEMYFLKEIGLSDELVARLASRNQKYQQMRQFA